MAGKPRQPSPLALDRVIHEPVRLGIVIALSARGTLTFKQLKERLHTTDGNLGVHARRLEAAGYVASAKSFNGRIPQTDFRMTARGRRAFATYRARLLKFLESG
jgi:DNA-binding MarR family transcriptional regulator